MLKRPLNFLSADKQSDALLPWVISVMLFLSALALSFALGVNRGLDSWSKGLTSTLTIQVVHSDTIERNRQAEATIKMVRATPGVTSANIMADQYVVSLLSPWLGNMPIGSGLPLPSLIDVTLDDSGDFNLDSLKSRLNVAAPDAALDDHQAWMRQILDLAGILEVLLIAIVVMITLCTITIVIFGCRAGLAAHQDTIEIMHLMGAEDTTIASAFDRRYLQHGLKGGAFGVCIASVVLYGVAYMAARMGQGLLNAALPDLNTVWWVLLLPILSGLLAMITARITIRRALTDMV